MHVLFIEDDELLASGVIDILQLQGFAVDHVTKQSEAEAVVKHVEPDLAIIDRGLPDGDGIQLVKRWRAEGIRFPVIMLTARDAISNRVEGLDAGADDYLVKPFDMDELVSRLRALARRAGRQADNSVTRGDLCLDLHNRSVQFANKPVQVSRMEWLLLETLIRAPAKIFTPDELYDRLHGFSGGVESNVLNVHIHHLRRKLGPNVIETVRGFGFRLGSCLAVEETPE